MYGLTPLLTVLQRLGTPVPGHRPWPRFQVADKSAWTAVIDELGASNWDVLALWGEPAAVHLALREDLSGEVAVVSLDCPDYRFPAVSTVRLAAQRLERSIQDLFGLVAEGLNDSRPWLDHGVWGHGGSGHKGGRLTAPLGACPDIGQPLQPLPEFYPMLPVDGEGLHQIPVGPVHAGIIEPGHFRFTANGETVVRLEERLGYVHKGIEGLMQGQLPAAAARLAARISGDSTVAHSLAFARAVEAALNVTVPPRAEWLRALMAEMERIANHIGDIGAICNDAAFACMLAECGQLRERVAETAQIAFGHRLMMDRVIPGGVAVDITPEGLDAVPVLADELRRRFLPLIQLYDTTTSLLDRTIGTGVISSRLVDRFAAGGYIGRASGRDFDSRSSLSYPPYNDLIFKVPKRNEGDVNARVWVRMLEVQESLGLLDQIITRLPGTARVADRAPPLPWVTLPEGPGEGMAVVEGFRGEILTWVRLAADGTIARCHPRDPSWFQWPLLEAAIEGNIVADFPLCNKSVNGSYSGHDL